MYRKKRKQSDEHDKERENATADFDDARNYDLDELEDNFRKNITVCLSQKSNEG